jgi:hypothetical protein
MISGFIPSRLPAVWGLMGPQREDRADFHCPVATESNIHRSQGSSGSRASDVGSVIRLETFLDGGKTDSVSQTEFLGGTQQKSL